MNLKNKIKSFDKRTFHTWKHIIASFVLKGGNIAINFLLVPLAIAYLGTAEYGIWVTLSSVFIWIGYLDIGLGNGMRNKLTEAIAVGNKDEATRIVSTTYFIISGIFISICLIFILVNPFIEWHKVFNVSKSMEDELSMVCLLVGGLFCIQFIIKLIGNVLLALQLAAWNNAIVPISNFMILMMFLFFLSDDKETSHLYFTALLFSLFPIIAYFLATIFLFGNKKYQFLRPRIKFFDKKYIKEVTGIGILFFIIQLSAVIMQSTTNLLITHLFDTTQVTYYDVSFKYINSARMFFFIIMIPYWSAVTDAFIRKDFDWIDKSFKNLTKISVLFIVGVVGLTIISPFIFDIWLGEEIKVPFEIVVGVALFVSGFIFTETTIQFLNGIGKIRLQAYLSVIVVIINIPIAILLSYTTLGIIGIVIAPLISRGLKYVFGYIQYKKIINGNAERIWNK